MCGGEIQVPDVLFGSLEIFEDFCYYYFLCLTVLITKGNVME